LGQQIAKPGGSLDRPGACFEQRGPCQQPFGLATVGPYLQLGKHMLVYVYSNSGVRLLVRVNPDHDHEKLLSVTRDHGGHS
jgi:hypothetical protein